MYICYVGFMEVEYFPQHLRQLIEEEHIIEKRAVEIEKKQKEMCKVSVNVDLG